MGPQATPASRPAAETFRLPRAVEPLPFTGERMTGAVQGQIEFEHYHRYCWARDLCAGRDVLDVASGEGYGTALLAGVARSATGVEIDGATVAHASANYRPDNLHFLQGDALALPLRDRAVDVVVSFETLEHVADQNRFLAEVRRVLRPQGLFIVSTPERDIYSAPGHTPNPYHTLELTEPAFRALLQAHFGTLCILRQRAMLGSLLLAPDATSWRSYQRHGQDGVDASDGLVSAPYRIALATDGALPEIASSVYLDRLLLHDVMQQAQRLPEIEERAALLADQLAAARRDAAGVQRMLDRVTQERDRVQQRLQGAERELAVKQATSALFQRMHREMLASTSWRITAPLRAVFGFARRCLPRRR